MKLKKPTKARLSFKRLLRNWLILIASLGVACLVCTMLHNRQKSTGRQGVCYLPAVRLKKGTIR